MQFLIGYDIVEPKRLQQIYRRMVKFALPIQYSVFLFDGSQAKLDEYLKTILAILNTKEDDLRIYPIPDKTAYWQHGKSILPEGIIWSGFC